MVALHSRFPALPALMPTNIAAFALERRPADAPDYVFQIDALSGAQRTWNAFKTRVRQATAVLAAPTVEGGLALTREKGAIVGVLSPNVCDYPVLFYACWSLAIPICPLSSFAPELELAQLLGDAGITELFVDSTLLERALAAARAVGLSEQHVHILEGVVPGRPALGDVMARVAARGVTAPPIRAVDADTLAYLLFSSGTSGRPKAVAVTHANLVAYVIQASIVGAATAMALPASSPDAIPVVLGFLPLHHTYGIGIVVLRPALAPTTVVVMRKWSAPQALALVAQHRITALALVPDAILQMVAAHRAQRNPTDLSSITAVGSGAAYLSEEVRKELVKIVPHSTFVSQGYGMSEATLTAMSTLPHGAPFADNTRHGDTPPGSVGLLWPGMTARIVGADDVDAAPGTTGELWLAGPNIVQGYWRDAKKTAETFVHVDGVRWLQTGDLFRVDENGNFFFVDRLKDTLKISGMQVSPSELEDALLEHPDGLVADAAVAGVLGPGRTPDERVPRAWVILSAAGAARGADAVVAVLHEWARSRLSSYKQLRGGIEVVQEIPKNATGKVLRRVLTEQYEAKSQAGIKAKL